ncbi:Helicase-like transcription factor CHR28 [Bienertia sinuspersici]
MMMAQEGLNIGLMNDFDFSDDVVEDDDDGFGIDADAFFNILNEENSDHPPLPIDPFYPSMDNTQESGSAIHVNDHVNVPCQTDYGAASENSAETVEAVDQAPHSSPPEMVLSEANDTSFTKNCNEANACQLPNYVNTESLPFGQDWLSILQISSASHPNSLTRLCHDTMSTNEAIRGNMKSDLDVSLSSHPWSDTKIAIETQVGVADATASQVHMYDFFDGKGPESFFRGSYPVQHVDTMNTFDNSSSSTTTDDTSSEPYHWKLAGKSCMKQSVETKDEMNNKVSLLNDYEWKSSEANTEGPLGGLFGSGAGKFLSYAEAQYSGCIAGGSAVYCPDPSFSHRKLSNVQLFEHPLPSADLFSEHSSLYHKTEGEEVSIQHAIVKPNLWEGTLEASKRCMSEGQSDVDDNNDLCILENMSEPAQLQTLSVRRKPVTLQPTTFAPQCSKSITPLHQMGASGTRLKASDESIIFQSLVQGLSQPKSEASPPDGALAVPLLRHQRIALSWMVQKETSSLHCLGGILADDQGLGKTVSTIALILTERPTSAKTLKGKEECEPETLDLDEEDDKQTDNKISSLSVKGRPSAGTLIVCPTSVIRQWDAELHSKVSSEANLSVYVYHGNSRTKDPYELAKHDVVLTTYSIVSMEVPRQPVVLKSGNDGRKAEVEDSSIQFNRKRKHSTSDNRRSKKEMDNVSGKSVAHPLAKVGWFRVVLDEAQSIKNHRTRVAQACWGLRAKRRWCLSGTPIQNAVDDLYSYFRFLKYDPYSVYSSFCSMVKIPITKTPSKGYPKLQAVLKNIMLRRTKGTLLDGKPIINLPPKSVMLKKVEFSEEERDFYSRLEADSRAQFQAYADSGTVKQNYVNILLMLLRLRQACDHPFLVEGGSSSVVKSSIHAAKSLPREKQIFLLSCLEGSQAICGVCRDPPEDAVVCICGHVFCNQCISLRLTGDDNQCPATNCKSELSASHVFSRGTLNSCLSDVVCQDNSHIPFAAGCAGKSELIESQPSVRFESSKIKAALEVLRSLSKPQVSVPDDATMLPTDINLLDKSNTAPFATDSESSNVSDGLSTGNSVVKEKAIVFSQWTRMLDLLEDCLKEYSIQYRRLDGTMSVAARDKAVQDFNTLPEVSVMIMSLKAASLGLNMVAACHVVLLDLWWNPTTEDQAIDRAHRIGQTRPVTVVRLTVKHTVEDRILALQKVFWTGPYINCIHVAV